MYRLLFICFVILLSQQLAQAYDKKEFKHQNSSNEQCINCHQKSQHQWLISDHSNSMAIADEKSVLADFSGIEVSHHEQKALFFIKNKRYQVTISYNETLTTYPIKYTFGYYPLQQYLVEITKGRLQVLPFAWDARDKEIGGQRWYHNYSDQEISNEDRLHWRQPLQNWNGMCADCHSSELKRNYNVANDQFSSTYKEINVGCISCHSNDIKHANQKNNRSIILPQLGQWLRNVGEKTAKWHGKARDNTFMDNCFACHSLRSPLTDGFKANVSFLDQFTPQLLSSPNYHVDGQIKEEVYVYGSFLQSKMYAAGVNCLDCHDKHTMKVKVVGNGLCIQCHSAEAFNTVKHHRHKTNSAGAQCINCHMPENRYMGVDDRRDHSFIVPKPHLSEQFETPNACIKCHDNQSNQWASKSLQLWHGKPTTLSANKAKLMSLNAGKLITLSDHLTIVADKNLDVISRASALQLLVYSNERLSASMLIPYFSNKEALIRLAAANVGAKLTVKERTHYLMPLLEDKFRAIRVAAAKSLVDGGILKANSDVFVNAFNELQQANTTNSWRGEGRVNQASLAIAINQFSTAENNLIQAIKIDPFFEPAHINLADFYRAQQKEKLVADTLHKGMKYLPESGALAYAFGLHLVRQQKLKDALAHFEKAMVLAPTNAQYAYTLLLALDGLGRSKQALTSVDIYINKYLDNTQLIQLKGYLSNKLKEK